MGNLSFSTRPSVLLANALVGYREGLTEGSAKALVAALRVAWDAMPKAMGQPAAEKWARLFKGLTPKAANPLGFPWTAKYFWTDDIYHWGACLR